MFKQCYPKRTDTAVNGMNESSFHFGLTIALRRWTVKDT